jgi:N-acetyl-anhydromuramyl-L-alanine amidase AmpD
MRRFTKTKTLLSVTAIGAVLVTGQATASADSSAVRPHNDIVCPAELRCDSVPAARASVDGDSGNYGNYDIAKRPKTARIDTVVVHNTEASAEDTLAGFQNPAFMASSHYLVDTDGKVTQTVHPSDVAWGAGNWWVNTHAINIEHVGFAKDGGYTQAQYEASAKLVRFLGGKYDIPLDRQHIVGHDEVPTLLQTEVAGAHWDPGPFWNWHRYSQLVGMKQIYDDKGEVQPGDVVEIDPDFDNNTPQFQDCDLEGVCTAMTPKPSSAVQLHVQPSEDSALVKDDLVVATGNAVNNWTSVAADGQRFVIAKTQGNWVGIFYGGKTAWLKRYDVTPVRDRRTNTVTAKKVVPVYGAALPESSAYPQQIPVRKFEKLYEIPAGQSFVAGKTITSDYYYSKTVDQSLPFEGTVVEGKDRYIPISFNHRMGYVKASDIGR